MSDYHLINIKGGMGMVTHIASTNYSHKTIQTNFTIKDYVYELMEQNIPVDLDKLDRRDIQPLYIKNLINRPSKFSEEGQALINKSLDSIKKRNKQIKKGQYVSKDYSISKEVKLSWFHL